MKRFAATLLALGLTAALGAPALAADEMTEVYRQIYLESVSLKDKYNAVKNLVALDDRSSAPILSEALQELLLAQNGYKDATERTLFGQTLRLLAEALGRLKYADSAPLLWTAAEEVPDPLAQAEAIIALGRMRALDYSERIALKLRNLNMGPTSDTDSGEKLAFACIVALDKFKDPQGFSPVFFASDGWYSLRVRKEAERVLPGLTADPTDPVIEIVTNEATGRKLKALQLEFGSSAPAQRKVAAATLAYSLGHLRADPNKPAEAKAYAELRKYSIRSLVVLRPQNADAVDSALRSYSGGYDVEEQLLALQLLGIIPGDEPAKALDLILRRLNEDVKNGVTDELKTRLGEAAVNAASVSKNPLLRPVLVMIANNQKWSGRIINAATTALKAYAP